MEILLWAAIIVAVIIAISEIIMKVIFRAEGTSVNVDGEVKALSPKEYEKAKGEGSSAAQSRMRIMFHDVDGEPLKKAVRYCRALHTKEYTITNDKGYKLYATMYMAPIETDKYMFFIHGYNMTGLSDGCRFIEEYAKLGFNCFVVDHVHEGRSEGKCVTFGEQESRDCIQWLKFMVAEFGSNIKIILHRMSIGGTTALLTAASAELPEQVKFAVDDCGYVSAKDEFVHVLMSYNLPKFLAMGLTKYIAFYYHLRFGYDLSSTDVSAVAENIKIPVLIMHGDDDIFVPHTMSEKVAAMLKSPGELHIFKGATHSISQYLYNDEYFGYIKAYMEKYL